jgi:hypothetical protein
MLESTALMIQKAFVVLDFITKSYHQTLFETANDRSDYAHDMNLVFENSNLKRLTYDLLGENDTVLFEHAFMFENSGERGKVIDSARGIELPFIRADLIRRNRLVWTSKPTGRTDIDCKEYQHLFRLRWVDAKAVNRANCAGFQSEHFSHITGSRANAHMFVDRSALHRGTVISVPEKGRGAYCFIEDDQLKTTHLFGHQKHLQSPAIFFPGQRLSYIVISVPRGLQARAIQKLN